MKNMRRGLGKGLGMGYKNLVPIDSHIHSLSAKGMKTSINLNARKIVEQYKVYKFDELPKDVQEKVLDKYRDINVDYDWWDSDYLALDNAEKDGFEVKDFNFSGFYSQGAGARINITGINKGAVGTIYKSNTPEYRRLRKLIDEESFKIVQRDNIYANYYSHENTFYLDYEIWDDDLVKEKDEDLIKDFTHSLQAQLRDRSKQLYKELEDDYDYQTSDEAIKETLDANDYEFRADGKLYSGAGQEVLQNFPKSQDKSKQKTLDAKGIANAKVFYSKKHQTELPRALYDDLNSDKETILMPKRVFNDVYVEMSKDKVQIEGDALPEELERLFDKYNDGGYAEDTPYSKGKNPLATPKGQVKVRKSGTHHTSMSVGDMVEVDGDYYIVADFGFKKVKVV